MEFGSGHFYTNTWRCGVKGSKLRNTGHHGRLISFWESSPNSRNVITPEQCLQFKLLTQPLKLELVK